MDGSTTKITTYSYKKAWSSTEHNSDKFKKTGYNNPKFPLYSKTISSDIAYMGDFMLNLYQIEQINDYENVQDIPINDNYKIFDNYYYKGEDIKQPQIGDVRISYQYVPSGKYISIIGKQNSDNTISEFNTSNGSFYLQYDGKFSLSKMLIIYKLHNLAYTFALRFCGWFIMFIGLKLLVAPILTIIEIIPFAEFLSSLALACITFLLSITTIALAWFAYRPLLTSTLLIFVCIGIYFTKRFIQNQKE